MNEQQIKPEHINLDVLDGYKQKLSEIINMCIEKGMFKEFCRLHGYSMPKTPIEVMIDQATGHSTKIANEFFDFVMEYVVMPMIEGQEQIRIAKN